MWFYCFTCWMLVLGAFIHDIVNDQIEGWQVWVREIIMLIVAPILVPVLVGYMIVKNY